jgi:hypothetical protein
LLEDIELFEKLIKWIFIMYQFLFLFYL